MKSLLSSTIDTVRPNSRHHAHFFHVRTRTETFTTSIVPSSVKLWNNANIGEWSTEHVSLSMKTYCNELCHVGRVKEKC